MRAKLKVRHGKNDGREIKIPGPIFLIGRSEDCHLRPKSDAISRRHCEISIDEKGVWVRDLGSKNGTLVNGEKITGEHVLRPGDILRVGRLEFEVLLEQSVAKRPKVEDVAQAAERTVEGGWGEDEISEWLLAEEQKPAQNVADPDTRQFRIDDTHQVSLDESAESKSEEEAAGDTAKDPKEKEDTDSFILNHPDPKKKPGKLPARHAPTSESSSQAAGDTLKKFFNNRS